MVRYLILRQFIHDISPKISFRNNRISAWTTSRRGHIRGVKFPDPTTWNPIQKTTINILTIQSTLCQTMKNWNLKQTTGTIVQTVTTTTKKTASLTTTPDTPINSPNPITIPPNTMLDTSKWNSHIPVIPARIHAVSSSKIQTD